MKTMKTKPKLLYKLKALIVKKYGKEKFLLGCEMVAQWIRFETKSNHTTEMIVAWTNEKKENERQYRLVNEQEFKAISKLFSLNNKEAKFFNQ